MKLIRKNYQTILLIMIGAFFMTSCTTIRVKEKDAFDAKKTVEAEYFLKKGISLEEIYFNSDDTTTLRAWYLKQPNARGTVLYLGGNGFLLAISADIIQAIYDQKMNVFAFDYRGYGQSTGNPSMEGIKKDAVAAYDFLIKSKDINPEKLIIQGHSMGTFFALWLSKTVESAGIVLESPITDAEDLTNYLVPFLLKPFINFDIDENLLQESNSKEIQNLRKPVLIITGAQDKITPVEMAEDLYKLAPVSEKKLYIIENGDHNNLPRKKEYRNEIALFYQKILNESLADSVDNLSGDDYGK